MFRPNGKPDLFRRTAIITGGSRGIGFATAQAFLGAGARIAICACDSERLHNAQATLGKQERVLASVTDVRDPAQVRDFVERVDTTFGSIDILVNNAGIASVGPFSAESYESMSAVIDVNLKGLMYMTRTVLPAFMARGGGVIINVSSGAGLTGFPDLVSYCASKFGVVGFTESLNEEVAVHGVRVYAICPGRVATDMQVHYSGAKVGIPPDQVAARIVQLAGSNPRARTGTCISVG